MASTPGRPPVGPKVETRLDAATLQRLDADATRREIGRARWLRDAAQHTLDCPLADRQAGGEGRHLLAEALGQVSCLSDLREWALDPEASKDERVIAAERYASTLAQMHTMITELREALPRQEARDAYAQAEADDPQGARPETARAWGRATAADQLDQLLDAFAMLLPPGGGDVRARAALDDPLMDLEP